MIPTSRCTVYPWYFYRRLFVQRAPKYQWQRRAVAVDHAWCCALREKKKEKKNEEEEEEDEEEIAVEEREAKTKRATAITGDERRKNDSCINTAHPGVYIYIYLCRLAMLSFRRAR